MKQGQNTAAPCMSNYICFKTRLMDSKDDKNSQILRMLTTVPTEGPRGSGEGQPADAEPFLLPSNAVCLGACGAAGSSASPPCSRTLSAMSCSRTVSSYGDRTPRQDPPRRHLDDVTLWLSQLQVIHRAPSFV